MELNKIYNESCLDTMKDLPDKCIDLVVTSPPYNMNLRVMKGKYTSRQVIKKEFSTKYEEFSDNLPLDEFYNLHSSILRELLRVSKVVFYNIQIVTGSKRAFFKLIGEFSDNLKEIIVWDKVNSQPAMQSGVLNRQSELILVFEDEENSIKRQFNTVNFERGTLNDVWQIKRGKKYDKKHGATFPEELVEKIIVNFSNKGELIYDPFMGSGTTAVVAKRLERNFLGSEISKKYVISSNERLSL